MLVARGHALPYGLDAPYYFVADAYYASRKIALPLLRVGHHLVTRVRNNKAGNQYLHRKTAAYRDAVRRKLAAYRRFIQLGLIAQGIMLALATAVPPSHMGLLRLVVPHPPARYRPLRSRRRHRLA